MVSKMAQREVGSQNYLLCKNTEATPVKIEMPKPDWKKRIILCKKNDWETGG